MRSYLALDCSTTASKAVVFAADGSVLAAAARALDLHHPHPGWHEQDARQWWSATAAAITDVVAQVDAAAIRSLCLTHQRESFVCLDAVGEPIRPAILWADGRAGPQIARLGTPEIHRLSGKPPDVTPALYKLAWLREHEPETLRRAARVGDVQAYLTWKLTGRWVTSHASADTLGLFDLRRLTWSPELLELAGLRADQLPELRTVGEDSGAVRSQIARLLGLPGSRVLPVVTGLGGTGLGGTELPVIAGIGDGQAAGLGANVTEPGAAYLNLGTSMVLGVQTGEYLTDPSFRTLAGAVPGTFTLETILNSAGYLTAWFRDQFGDPALAGAPDPELDAAAAALPPGADGLLTLPYWNAAQTPHWDAAARGATIGWHGGHTRAHLYRSILEAVGFELRMHLEGLEAATGQRVTVLRAMGGGSRSALWTQLIADITGRPVAIGERDEVSALGAAVIAQAADEGAATDADHRAPPEADERAATGLRRRSLAEVAAAMAGPVRTVSPRPEVRPAYQRYFEVYRGLYPRLKPIFAELSAIPD